MNMRWLLAPLFLLALVSSVTGGRPPSAVFMGKASIQRYECCHLLMVNQPTDTIIVLDAGNGKVHFQLTRLGSQNDTFNVLDGILTGHHGYVLRLQPAIYRATITPALGEPRYLLLFDLNGN